MTVNTPYDDVFKTLTADCTQLLIPLINEVFGESFTEDEAIGRLPNEHYMGRQGAELREIITDTYFAVGRYIQKKYHIECQSTEDGSMIMRMAEYDTEIALDEAEIAGTHMIVTLPHSAVLYLRYSRHTSDEMTITFRTSEGELDHQIPIVKAGSYTLEEIFEKKLLFLIPFYIFGFEKKLPEYEDDQTQREAFIQTYVRIREQLEALCEAGEITEYIKTVLMELSQKVVDNLAEHYIQVRKGVESVMGGKVLETQAKKMLNQGREEGLLEGKREGLTEGMRSFCVALIQNGKLSLEDGAEQLKISVEELQQYMDKRGLQKPVN